MDKKAIIAIAVVAILAVGGCAAAAMLMNNGESENLKVDKVSTEVKAGDYITYSVNGTTKINTERADISSNAFLNAIIYNSSFSSSTPISTDLVEYKGTYIECKCYESSGSYYYIGPKDVVYRYTLSGGPDYRLKDTNLDLSKDAASQTVSSTSCYSYTLRQTQGDMTAEGVETYEYISFIDATKSGTMRIITDMTMTGSMTKTVASVGADGKITLKDGSSVTKNDFLSYVSKDCMIQNLKDNGYTVTEGQKTQKVMDTAFGKRNVTVEDLKSVKTSSDTQTYTITYGDNGVLYTVFVSGTEETLTTDSTMTVEKSSLITS